MWTLMISVFVIVLAAATNFYSAFVGGVSAAAGDVLTQVDACSQAGVDFGSVEDLKEVDPGEVKQAEEGYVSDMLDDATREFEELFGSAQI